MRSMGGKATNPPSVGVPTDRSKSVGCPSAAQVCARVQRQLAEQRRTVPGPLVRQPAPAARLAAILHNAAMDLWDVATEQDAAQMWEEARAIASRILAACPTA